MRATRIELEGAVVAVTGGGRGIGRATAERFARAGAAVCIGDLDADAATDAAAAIGTGAQPFALDVRSRESFEAFVRAATDSVGAVDILVNNAGIMPTGRFLEESEAMTETVWGVNVVGVVNGMRAVLPSMIARRRGHVVNVGSMLGKTQLPGLATYTASKHAVVGLTAAIRPELAGTGVTVTAVLPSVVNTELSAGISLGIGRLIRVEPEDVAAAIVGTLDGRPKEVAVPRWLALYSTFAPLIPDLVEDFVRRVIGDDKAITAVDPDARAAYEERARGQA